MERSLPSRFFILSNSSALFTYLMTNGVHLSKYFEKHLAISAAESSNLPEFLMPLYRLSLETCHFGRFLKLRKNTCETLFFIVDLHVITLPYDTQQLSKVTRDTTALYLACGVDTSKASVFVKSLVRARVELMWLLSSAIPIGWLNRMIRFKEKSWKGDENVGVTLLTYPVLMASDILLYQSDYVPVGEDQKQHLELTRELAERVNYLFGGRKWKKLGGNQIVCLYRRRGGAIFKVPEPLIPPAGTRVMSLADGLSKMSKSAPSDQLRINFARSQRSIRHTVFKKYLQKNLLLQEVAEECQDMNWGTFINVLTDALVDHLHPIQVQYEEIMSDPAYLDTFWQKVPVKLQP